jgi:hypothetical protein
MENVSARCAGTTIDLPAGPAYRLHKEVKNVITSIAKTFHYWDQHMWTAQQREIGRLFETLSITTPFIQPAEDPTPEMAAEIERHTGLRPSALRYRGWLGLECPSVESAIWMMRALVASNVLARREQTVLFVPAGDVITREVVRIHAFAREQTIL